MMQVLLIGIGAGAVAALIFAALASGSLLSMVLFYLAPLPILIAALGWSYAAGIAAVLTRSAAPVILLFGWPLLAAALLGLADGLFDLRRRAAAKRRPPSSGPIV